MSATAAQQTPAVPPRPSRGQDKDQMPKIPPRPIKNRIERSLSPNPDRFAPSPLNDEFLNKSPRSKHLSPTKLAFPSDPIDRAASVEMPSVGEEGMEYAVVAEELNQSRRQSTSPEQTRTVGEDIKLHAPKPSLPAVSAKQRVAAVTRTDSDRAASFGIGRPSSDEVTPSNRSLKKKASTASQLSTTESHTEEEHGIPEIGQQVPMYRDAGDVQAPSPAPGSEPPKKHHARKTSARGLPPGSYGLHGHGVVSNDKLDKMYYQKHPDELKKERHSHHHDRPNDFSMSSDDLNKIVRDTHGRGLGLGTRDLAGTPSEQIGWQAIEESTSRLNSPHPASAELARPAKTKRSASDSGNGVIHVEEPSRRRSVMFSDGETAGVDDFQGRAETPILAADEVAKDPLAYEHEPAVEPPRERRGSAYEMEEPQSRPTSRPASLYKVPSSEIRSTPLEDVVEYEPLFEDDKVNAEKKSARKSFEEYKARFPSKDIWEDAPNSVHYTAEVSTPDIPEEKDEGEEQKTMSENIMDIPPREGETPAQAFARHQEELAQKEFRQDPEAFLHRKQKPTFVQHHAHLAKQVKSERPSMSQRFPSRDVWEDTPDSLKLETTVSTPQQESGDAASPSVESKPSIPQRPGRKSAETTSPSSDKPAVPERPNAGAKPPVSDRPKPQIPPRPVKQGSGSSDKDADAAPRSKPAVPVRPMGSKIAALQAGFMSDLNKRLQLGPQAPKKEEQPAEEERAAPVEEKEKVPLSDARKGRARGPQRRAPRSSPSPAAALSGASEQKTAATLAFSTTVTTFSINPEDGGVSVPVGRAPVSEPASAVEKEEPVTEKATTAAAVAEHELEKAAPEEKRAHPAPADVVAHEIEKAPEAEAPAAAFEKTETLATNTAGETLLETKVSEDAEDNKKTVEPKEVDEVVKN